MKEKYQDITYTVLSILTVVGMVTIAITAPNLFQVFGQYAKWKRVIKNWNFRRSLKRMKTKGLISYKDYTWRITKKGYNLLDEYKLESIQFTSETLDKVTRLIVFDIPLERNKVRIKFVNKLKELGFKYFQKSVWSINRKCEKEVFEIAEILKISPYIKIIVVKEIIAAL